MNQFFNLFRDQKQGRLFLLLVLTSIFDVILLLYRNHELGHLWVMLENWQEAFIMVNVTFIFLAWNLFLAWIPYLISLQLEWISQLKGGKIWIAFALISWLLFFPNAPYLITDLLHLRYRAPIPLWFDMMLFFSFAWTGLILGFLSLQEVQLFLNKRLGRQKSSILVYLSLLLCGFGIYIGRFQRWNTWDVVSNPGALIGDITSILSNPMVHMSTLGLAIVISGLLFLGYFTIQTLTE